MALYYRQQPTGLPLLGHTSECTGDDRLDEGYVFAYDRPEGIVQGINDWGLPEDKDATEVIVFEGEDAYDPGDFEGVAVLPVREISRTPLRQWVQLFYRPEPGVFRQADALFQ